MERDLVPRAEAEGYAGDIDWLAIPARLETGWIRSEIAKLAAEPNRIAAFKRIAGTVHQVGLGRWRQMCSEGAELAHAHSG
jgi:hypothetical protein